MPRNRGKRLERLLDYMHAIYKNRKIADIVKLHVSTKYHHQLKTMKYMEKTGFDYSGTLKGGRSICVEAKETEQPRLPISKTGLKLHQVEALLFRGELNAFVGVIWMMGYDDAYFIGYKFLKWFMEKVYDKKIKGKGRPVKSISMALVKKYCPLVMQDGKADYLRYLGEDIYLYPAEDDSVQTRGGRHSGSKEGNM